MISELKNRRQANVAQAMGMLDLVESSDLETKRSLLSIAARCLNDREVALRWIQIAQQETDLRRPMIAALQGKSIPDLKQYVALLTSSLTLESCRTLAIEELGRILVHAPEAVDHLIEMYAHQQRTSVKRHILAVLLDVDRPKVLDFLSAAVTQLPTGDATAREFQRAIQEIAAGDRSPQEKTDAIARLQQEFQEQVTFDYARLKLAIIDRLLRKDRFDPKWLQPAEPVSVRRRVLAHLLDRPADCNLEQVLAHDPDPECRQWAVRAITQSGPLLEAVRRDRDPQVRKAALAALESIEFDPSIIDTIRNESSPENVEVILRRLAPHAARSEQVRTALLSLLGPDLKAGIAKAVYEILGRVLTRELFEIFLTTYESAREDRIRAAILRALSTWHEPDERLARLYVAALKSPHKEIRLWGAQGLILLPLTESNIEAIGAGADAILELPRESAKLLAEKIAKIPNPSAEVRAALKRVADSDDEDLRYICRKAIVGDVDWDRWLKLVSVEHTLQGVFPEIYAAYDSNPKAARQILRTAVLDPQCRSHDVSPVSILEFLIDKQGLDDDLCRFCLDNAGGYLAFLKLRPDLPELKHRIWEVMGKEVNPVLLRELLVMIFGSDEAAGDAVRARVVELDSAPGARPWIKFLLANILWPPARPILGDVVKIKAIMDRDNRKALEEFAPPQGPGLADE